MKARVLHTQASNHMLKTGAALGLAMALGAAASHFHDTRAGHALAPLATHQPQADAWPWDHPFPAPPVSCSDAATGTAPSTTSEPVSTSPQDLLDKLVHERTAEAAAPPPPSAFDTLVEQLRHDPQLRESFLKRLATEAASPSRGTLVSLLTSAGGDDIARFASQRLQQADPAQRRLGLDMLAGMQSQQAPAREALWNAATTETDAGNLSMLIANLMPPSEQDAQAVAAMSARMQQWAQHDAPAVRAAAIQAMARWDDEAAEAGILKGLSDTDFTVQEAAIHAAGETGARGDATKDTLLRLAEQSDAPLAIRQMAVDALDMIRLDSARSQRVAALKKVLDAAV